MSGLVKFIGMGLFLIALSANAEESSDAEHIETLLNQFLAGAAVNDVKMHDRFWAEDLIYTSSSGRRFGKAALMASLSSEPAADEQRMRYTAEELQIKLLDDVAIIAFRLVGESASQRHYYLNSGTLVKRDNQWRVVNWQATHMHKE